MVEENDEGENVRVNAKKKMHHNNV